MSLRKKLLTGFLLFCVLYGLGLYASLTSVQALRRFAATDPRFISLLNEMNVYSILLEQIESQVDDLFVANYPEKRMVLFESLDRMRQVEAVMASDVSFLGIPYVSSTQAADTRLRASMTALLETNFSGAGINVLAANVYTEIRSLKESNEVLLVGIRDTATKIAEEGESVFGRLTLELMLTGSAMLFALVGLILFLSQAVMSPLRKIMVAADNLRRGEFGRKTGIETGDELGQLATIIDDASESLQKEKAMEQRSRDMEKELKLRASLLETKVKEHERLNKLLIDRELRMIELKKQLAEATGTIPKDEDKKPIRKI